MSQKATEIKIQIPGQSPIVNNCVIGGNFPAVCHAAKIGLSDAYYWNVDFMKEDKIFITLDVKKKENQNDRSVVAGALHTLIKNGCDFCKYNVKNQKSK